MEDCVLCDRESPGRVSTASSTIFTATVKACDTHSAQLSMLGLSLSLLSELCTVNDKQESSSHGKDCHCSNSLAYFCIEEQARSASSADVTIARSQASDCNFEEATQHWERAFLLRLVFAPHDLETAQIGLELASLLWRYFKCSETLIVVAITISIKLRFGADVSAAKRLLSEVITGKSAEELTKSLSDMSESPYLLIVVDDGRGARPAEAVARSLIEDYREDPSPVRTHEGGLSLHETACRRSALFPESDDQRTATERDLFACDTVRAKQWREAQVLLGQAESHLQITDLEGAIAACKDAVRILTQGRFSNRETAQALAALAACYQLSKSHIDAQNAYQEALILLKDSTSFSANRPHERRMRGIYTSQFERILLGFLDACENHACEPSVQFDATLLWAISAKNQIAGSTRGRAARYLALAYTRSSCYHKLEKLHHILLALDPTTAEYTGFQLADYYALATVAKYEAATQVVSDLLQAFTACNHPRIPAVHRKLAKLYSLHRSRLVKATLARHGLIRTDVGCQCVNTRSYAEVIVSLENIPAISKLKKDVASLSDKLLRTDSEAEDTAWSLLYTGKFHRYVRDEEQAEKCFRKALGVVKAANLVCALVAKLAVKLVTTFEERAKSDDLKLLFADPSLEPLMPPCAATAERLPASESLL